MPSQHSILEIDVNQWTLDAPNADWISALEAGKVLYFPHLQFQMSETEKTFLTPEIRHPKSRNISLDVDGSVHGVFGDTQTQEGVATMVGRFRAQALSLVHSLVPAYTPALRIAPTSYRPTNVETRTQSWRADDRRLHVDAFPSRPNYGERILRVFTNVNPHGQARVWRVGESFETVAKQFLPRAKPYKKWQAKALHALHVTKTFRSEYDHLMLQLHDGMKADADYQQQAPQCLMPFPPGSVWICFSDQASHAVMSGQFMMEQTLHLPAEKQYHPEASPLAVLTSLVGRALV